MRHRCCAAPDRPMREVNARRRHRRVDPLASRNLRAGACPAAVAGRDAGTSFRRIVAHHGSTLPHAGSFDVGALAVKCFLQLSPGRLERLAERNEHVVLVLPARDDPGATRHADVDPNVELLTLTTVIAGAGHRDAATRDARLEVLEAGDLFPDARIQGG